VEGAWLARLRWRRRGAWLVPAFAGATILDAVVGHLLPMSGETQTLLAALLAGWFLNLIAVVLLCLPLGAVYRRLRPDMPKVVARDYAGTTAVAAVAVTLAVLGLAHRPAILANDRAMRDAITRAQAWIGDRAPAEYRRNLAHVSTAVIEPGNIYRTCVASDRRPRTYCVVVKRHLPLAQSVSFDGYESNDVFSAGTG
jgi:hypothetical protein